MTERETARPRLSRRAALAGTALAFGAATAAAVAGKAAAQEKVSPSDAKYQGAPNGKDHCELCANFQPPHGCKFVQGEISPNGWRQLFTPKG